MTDQILITDSPEIEPVPLWDTACFVCTNPIHPIVKDALRSLIYADVRRSESAIQSDVAVTAKHQVKESELDFLLREDPNIELLNQTISELVTTVATEVNAGFWPEGAEATTDITESWYHVTRNGGYHDAHSHPNCSWCGIYYLDVGDANLAARNGVNRFYDPRHNADHYLDAGAQYLNSTGIWDIEPVEGQVVIFPSYLKHSALPYFGEKDRLIIAFNTQVHFV